MMRNFEGWNFALGRTKPLAGGHWSSFIPPEAELSPSLAYPAYLSIFHPFEQVLPGYSILELAGSNICLPEHIVFHKNAQSLTCQGAIVVTTHNLTGPLVCLWHLCQKWVCCALNLMGRCRGGHCDVIEPRNTPCDKKKPFRIWCQRKSSFKKKSMLLPFKVKITMRTQFLFSPGHSEPGVMTKLDGFQQQAGGLFTASPGNIFCKLGPEPPHPSPALTLASISAGKIDDGNSRSPERPWRPVGCKRGEMQSLMAVSIHCISGYPSEQAWTMND